MTNEIMSVFNKKYDKDKARDLLSVIKDTLIEHEDAIGIYYTLKIRKEITEEFIEKFIDKVKTNLSSELNSNLAWDIQLRKIVKHDVTYFLAGSGNKMKVLLLVGMTTHDGFSPTLEVVREMVARIIKKVWKSFTLPGNRRSDVNNRPSLFFIDAFNIRRKFVKQSIPQTFGNVVNLVNNNLGITFCSHSPIKSKVEDGEFLAHCTARIKFSFIPNNTTFSKWGLIPSSGYRLSSEYKHFPINSEFIDATVGF